MAIGEALTNIASARIRTPLDVKLSANWMAAVKSSGEDASLYDTVKAVALELCPALGISIPVGKDSVSMKTVWTDDDGRQREVTAPLSLIVSGVRAVTDAQDADAAVAHRPGRDQPVVHRSQQGKQRLRWFGVGAGLWPVG